MDAAAIQDNVLRGPGDGEFGAGGEGWVRKEKKTLKGVKKKSQSVRWKTLKKLRQERQTSSMNVGQNIPGQNQTAGTARATTQEQVHLKYTQCIKKTNATRRHVSQTTQNKTH